MNDYARAAQLDTLKILSQAVDTRTEESERADT